MKRGCYISDSPFEGIVKWVLTQSLKPLRDFREPSGKTWTRTRRRGSSKRRMSFGGSRRRTWYGIPIPQKSLPTLTGTPIGRARSRLKNRHIKEEMLQNRNISTLFLLKICFWLIFSQRGCLFLFCAYCNIPWFYLCLFNFSSSFFFASSISRSLFARAAAVEMEIRLFCSLNLERYSKT